MTGALIGRHMGYGLKVYGLGPIEFTTLHPSLQTKYVLVLPLSPSPATTHRSLA